VHLILNVRATNPAARLYRRLGCERIAGSDFKTHTSIPSYGMLRPTMRRARVRRLTPG